MALARGLGPGSFARLSEANFWCKIFMHVAATLSTLACPCCPTSSLGRTMVLTVHGRKAAAAGPRCCIEVSPVFVKSMQAVLLLLLAVGWLDQVI